MESPAFHNGQVCSVFSSVCVFECRYLSAVTPAEAAANVEQSREKLAELKNALRALGFNKSVQHSHALITDAYIHLDLVRSTVSGVFFPTGVKLCTLNL